METALIQPILIALIVGLSSGAIGSFVILKRMALVGDALSHVALPGIAVALAYGVDPFWGVIASMIAAAFIISLIQTKTILPVEAVVGVLFTASLAIGVLTIPDHEIIESLFGEFPRMSSHLFSLVFIAALLSVIITFLLSKKFIFSSISAELFEIRGNPRLYNLAFLLVFAVIVAFGIKLMGTLLMGALTILPAVTAKNITRSMKSYIIASSILGAAISVTGLLIAYRYNFLPGPTIILLGVAFFFISLIFVKKW